MNGFPATCLNSETDPWGPRRVLGVCPCLCHAVKDQPDGQSWEPVLPSVAGTGFHPSVSNPKPPPQGAKGAQV